ncbi:atherin-like [Eulemur rufifrons]|uniref:atherin-like n=1 Tax=Eulemur rufifrons TaxID=859984 RepID=UPI0037429609
MNGPGAASAEGPSEEAQGLSRKRVANAVRKVVSKVLPGEELGGAKEPPGRGVKSPEHPARGKRGEKAAPSPKPPPPPPPPPVPPKHEAKKEAAKDELSVGLRSLMSRGRGKDHKPRGKQSPGKGEKPSSQEPGSPKMVDSPGKAGSPATPETREKQCSPALPEELADPGSAGRKSNLTGEQPSKSPASGVQQEDLGFLEPALPPFILGTAALTE